MRRFNLFPYFLPFLFLFLVLSLSPKKINPLRVLCIQSVATSWQKLKVVRAGFSPALKNPAKEIAIQKDLEAENHQLKEHIESMRHWMLEEERFSELFDKLEFLSKEGTSLFTKESLKRREQEALRLLKLHAHAIVGNVVYRDPALWSSFIWVNLGEVTNSNLDTKVIAKNSPVLSRGCLVGIVEEVFDSCCKVRLITDKRLSPSVRAYRGHEQESFLHENMEIVLSYLQERKELFFSEEEAKSFLSTLQTLKEKAKAETLSSLLAKGTISGMSAPLWKGASTTLEGMGFNYDFSDEEGLNRNLRDSSFILNVGDLLVTTGLDGVFPAGLKVAVVTKIHPLTEGACSYLLEAKACETRIGSLEKVTIVSPLDGYVRESPLLKNL